MFAIRSVIKPFLLLAALALLALPAEALAQTGNQGPAVPAVPAPQVVSSSMPDRIQRPMQAIDPVTLRGEGFEIRLWGIDAVDAAGTPLALRAVERLDQLIAGRQVNCKIEGGTIPALIGRCATADQQDLGFTLLNEGLAVRNRRQTYATTFAQGYGQAEEFARTNRKGVWAYLSEGEEDQGTLSPGMLMSLLIGVPTAGFICMGLLIWVLLQRVVTSQRMEFERARKKENALADRERSVMISMLEGELSENKNKIEAFVTIYGDMLRSLKDLSETPKYQQVGDIVQRHPSYSHIVFDANVNKLSWLGLQLAGRVSKLYAALPRTQEYITLDPNVPLETAVKLVEKTVNEAKDLDEPLSAILRDLQQVAENKTTA